MGPTIITPTRINHMAQHAAPTAQGKHTVSAAASDHFIPANQAEELLQYLTLLPPFTICEDNSKHVHLMPPPPNSPTEAKTQEMEYASVERLTQMIDIIHRLSQGAVETGTRDELRKIVMKLRADHQARFWFLANKNPEVAKGAEFWNQNKLRQAAAALLSPAIPCMQALRLLDQYKTAIEAIAATVK